MKFTIIAVVSIIVLGAGWYALQPASPAASISPQPSAALSPAASLLPASVSPEASASAEASPTASASASAIRTIAVEANQFTFVPNKIRLNVGERVKFVVTSPDVAHSFSSRDLGIAIQVPAGGTGTGEFTPTAAGTFSFRCAVQCGEGHMDMKGTIIVEN